ncbi:hypothetical protein A7A08_00898 [Methyloligella halotolerans]|uniref:DUF3784 domain-containing protein n=1 Tax=Methyloligella halotolerans TaxID=1177755 RepID=A0A1E2S3U0_9HYPH|nr:hypothetical protein [Methyloligella halotolerans]ODA69062.1 hypothetical protein A7A08_00898 [Methyloligella halotolerans]
MTTLLIVFLVLGAIATALFFAGYTHGTIAAMRSHNDQTVEVDDSKDIQRYGWPVALAVLAAATIIGLMGVAPAFIYVAPVLTIVTAAVNGIAFFAEDRFDRGS